MNLDKAFEVIPSAENKKETLISSHLDDEQILVDKIDEKQAAEKEGEVIDYNEKLRNKVLEFLEKKHALEIIDGLKVVDFDMLFSQQFGKELNDNFYFGEKDSKGKSPRGSYKLLFETMSDMEVISREDYDESPAETKPKAKAFFNIPESIDGAFDVKKAKEEAKEKKYYLNFWDAHSKEGGRTKKWNYNITAKDGSEIGARELKLFHTIFVENQGERDEKNGDLKVFDRDKEDFVKLSVDWLEKYAGGSFYAGYIKQGEGIHSFLKEECPNIFDKNLITLKDFNVISGSPRAELSRIERGIEPKNGYVMFNNVKYYIGKEKFIAPDGKEIPTNELVVKKLDENTAGIFQIFEGENKTEDLLYTLDLLSPEEKQQKINELGEKMQKKHLSAKELSSRITVNKEDSRIKAWSVKEENPRHQGETEDEYDLRIQSIKSYQHIKNIEKDFAEKCNFGIHDNLTWREQQLLASAVYELGENEFKNRLLPFAKKFGLPGLRTFLSFEFDKGMSGKILDMSQKLDENAAEKVFSHYAKIQEKATVLQGMLDKIKQLPNIDASDVLMQKIRGNAYDALMSRATDILNVAFQIAQQGKVSAKFYNGEKIKIEDINEVTHALELYEDSLEKIHSFFSGKGNYNFSHAQSSEYEGLNLHNFVIDNNKTGETSYFLVSLRKEGTNKHSSGLEFDGEARINLLASKKPISTNIQDASRREAMSVRLDRECLKLDESGKKIGPSDYTRKDGRLSLDLGSIYKDSGRENNILSNVVSVGNFYSAQEKKKAPEYYHNKEAFYSELGQADVFKKIVEMIDDFIKLKYIDNKKQLEKAA